MDNYQDQTDIARSQTDKSRFVISIYISALICLFIAIAYAANDYLPWLKGVYPLSAEGLSGIFTAPLVHADGVHLAGNISALFILFLIVFNNFNPMAWKLIIAGYLIPGAWAWFFARPAWHVGASGWVYTLASFIFFAGLIRHQTRLMSLSLFVVFMYGSIFWGIFPLFKQVSWETHLSGFLLGLLLALYYRKDLKVLYPEKKYFQDETDDEESENDTQDTNE